MSVSRTSSKNGFSSDGDVCLSFLMRQQFFVAAPSCRLARALADGLAVQKRSGVNSGVGIATFQPQFAVVEGRDRFDCLLSGGFPFRVCRCVKVAHPHIQGQRSSPLREV